MNDTLNTREVGRLLSRSAEQLDQETLGKLQSARRTALNYQKKPQQAPVLSWLTQHGLISHHSSFGHKTLGFGIAMLLAVVLLGSVYYSRHTAERDHAEIDIAILTDDLPVSMYVD
jgi:hypothetical protein